MTMSPSSDASIRFDICHLDDLRSLQNPNPPTTMILDTPRVTDINILIDRSHLIVRLSVNFVCMSHDCRHWLYTCAGANGVPLSGTNVTYLFG